MPKNRPSAASTMSPSGVAEDKLTHRSATPIEVLQSTGPDWMSNKFDIFFVWMPSEGQPLLFREFDRHFFSTAITPHEKFILSHRGFAVRTGKVKIPATYNDSFTINFLEQTIDKVASTKIMRRDSEFSIRLDDNLYWIDQLQKAAGRNTVVDDYIQNPSAGIQDDNPYVQSLKQQIGSGALNEQSYRQLIKTVAQSWSTQGVNAAEGAEIQKIRDYELCLIVKMQHFQNKVNTADQSRTMPYFIFEGVKILGPTQSIVYSNYSYDPLVMNVAFIFKRCYQVQCALTQIELEQSSPGKEKYEKEKPLIPMFNDESQGSPLYAQGSDSDADATEI